MSSKIMLDSSLLIEFRKGSQTDLFEAILDDDGWSPCICQAVASEYFYHHLAIFGGKSPLSLKTSAGIGSVIGANDPALFLQKFDWTADGPGLFLAVSELMGRWSLLPNDALILAICKISGIRFVASFDADFEAACRGEKLVLIRSVDELKKAKSEN